MKKLLKAANGTKSVSINCVKATVLLSTFLGASVAQAIDFEVGAVKASVYGYAQATFTYDLDHDLGRNTYGLVTMPAEAQRTDGTFNGNSDQSRIGLKTDANGLKFKMEGHFYGAGSEFKLRHAYGQHGNWLAGQFWTNFMLLEHGPGSLDFQGAAGGTFALKPQIRYTTGGLSVAVESSATNSKQPALTGRYELNLGKRKMSVAGIYNGDVEGTAGQKDDVMAFAVGGTTPLWGGASLTGTYLNGKGISDYTSFGGDTLDASGNAIEMVGYNLGLTQKVGRGTVGLTYGHRENEMGLTTASVKSVDTLHLYYNHKPRKNVAIGIEYYTGETENFSGDTDSADRVISTWRYSF